MHLIPGHPTEQERIPQRPQTRMIRRRSIAIGLLLALMAGLLGGLPAQATAARPHPIPAGLSAADWSAIQDFLPPVNRGTLRASNADPEDSFGSSVAADGDTIVVGAYWEDGENNATWNSGAAYVFTHTSGAWGTPDILRAPQPNSQDIFGWSVAVSGDTIVVGATYDDGPNNSTLDAGAAYVYTRTAGGWSAPVMLQAAQPQANSQFGWSVAIGGDTIVVGAPWADNQDQGESMTGAAHVFTRSNGEWAQQTRLTGLRWGDGLGWGVALSGDTMIIGVPNDNGPELTTDNAGAAYVFTRTASLWSPQAILRAPQAGIEDYFGRSVAISGDTAVVGAPWDDGADNTITDGGAAFAFRRADGAWSAPTRLAGADLEPRDEFGATVAIDGDLVLIGAPNESNLAGAAYVFTPAAETWVQGAKLRAPDNQGGLFGASVAVTGERLVIGAPWDGGASSSIPYSGAVYAMGPNYAPTAEAGADQTVETYATVTLDGRASSDSDGDPVNARWEQTGGPAVALGATAAITTTFAAPADPAVLTFTLTLTDSFGLAATDSVVITVENQAPTAEAGPDQAATFFEVVTLAGASSDPDGDSFTMLWTQIDGPAVTLSDPTAATPAFMAPARPATLIFALTVTDGYGSATADSVTITIRGHQVFAPLLQR